ncbi:MAG: hypothetical protein HYX53_10855 [Chloroflexi bacterium]|nr:hypothetical protein [Chloroflexota bacterium]
MTQMLDAGVTIQREIDDVLVAQVIRVKMEQTPISLADSFAVAYAATTRATLVTTGRGRAHEGPRRVAFR